MGHLVDDLLQKGEGAVQDALSKGEKLVRELFGLEGGTARVGEQRLADVLSELLELTTDESAETVKLRSVMVYRALVLHVKSGGTVKLIGPGTEVKTLKVRLR